MEYKIKKIEDTVVTVLVVLAVITVVLNAAQVLDLISIHTFGHGFIPRTW